MKKPLVSIVIPVYNREEFILETLDSLLAQSYDNWECIIVDDHSTDKSVFIINDFIKTDSRFKLFKRPDNLPKGANSCRNFGFHKSLGKYVNWIDSDDVLHKDCIKNKVLAFTTDIDAVISKTAFFEQKITSITGKEERTKITTALLEDFIETQVSWFVGDPMWKRDFLEDKNLFSPNLQKGQDRDFHIRILLSNPRLKVIDEYLYFYRMHFNTISRSKSTEVVFSMYNANFERIKLLHKKPLRNMTKRYLLKQQYKLLPHIYKKPNVIKKLFSLSISFFHLNISYFIWCIRFLIASLLLKTTGKGAVVLKD